MKLAGDKRGLIPFDQLILPGDFPRRLKAKHVKELAESLESDGLINIPLVDKATGELVAGADRVAAMRLNGLDKIPCLYGDFRGPAGQLRMRRLRAVENARRRCSSEERDSWLRELVAVAKEEKRLAELEAKATAERPKAVGAAPKPERAAIREVAAETGLSERTVERAIRRQHEDDAPAQEADTEEAPEPQDGEDESPPPCVPLLGVDPPPGWLEQVAEVQSAVDMADAAAQRLQRELKRLETLPFSHSLFQRLYDAAHTLAVDVRAARPVSVCPWCKLAFGRCTACEGRGYMRDSQAEGCPRELLDEDKDLVARNGRFVPRASVTGEPAQTSDAPPSRRRTLRIEDEHGNELTPKGWE